MDDFLALVAATTLIFRGTCIALNEQKMTTTIRAVYMGIGRFATLMAMSDDFLPYPLSQSFIKHKILAMEFVLQSLFYHGVSVVYDPTFKVEYIFKPLM